ncbi:MAG: hypothetical protein LBS77_04845 [Desulfovibrio sp.]|jgi:hypothetical protein|nr:hypothetical protein [Desulfovibrio sp.]
MTASVENAAFCPESSGKLTGRVEKFVDSLFCQSGTHFFDAAQVGRDDHNQIELIINHLDLAEVRLLKQLERVKVVSLNVQVLDSANIYAFFPAGAQDFGNGCVGREKSLLLSRSVKAVAFLRAFYQ